MMWFRRFLANLPNSRRWALEAAIDCGVGLHALESEANRLLIYRFNLR